MEKELFKEGEYQKVALRNAGGRSQFLPWFLENYTKTGKDVEKTIILGKKRAPKKQQQVTQRGKSKGLSSKQRKKLMIVDPAHHKYELYQPLHKLWTDYMRSILNFEEAKLDTQTGYHKLLKADYHGCLVTVAKSKCPSRVGLSGIVIQETKHTFCIITKNDEFKRVPKADSVFTFVLEDHLFTIYGKHFTYTAAERTVRKFKPKTSIDL